MGLKMEQY